ncbi:hypothetical protein GOP47_0017375 [Adiantum capillus-veneris]|uniref:Uncharacterized protein n=1 Tax=Adiantum capillus-veneris TaxID=13818 RepID=A0A9D4ZAI6_ADICA|nr:hypothetical protein GOP47_0017375 [Adiantum capillus-veneris]
MLVTASSFVMGLLPLPSLHWINGMHIRATFPCAFFILEGIAGGKKALAEGFSDVNGFFLHVAAASMKLLTQIDGKQNATQTEKQQADSQERDATPGRRPKTFCEISYISTGCEWHRIGPDVSELHTSVQKSKHRKTPKIPKLGGRRGSCT